MSSKTMLFRIIIKVKNMEIIGRKYTNILSSRRFVFLNTARYRVVKIINIPGMQER
jgi:hypothetical protein